MKRKLSELDPSLRCFELIFGEHYCHHGICLGLDENLDVIDFGGDDKASAKPRKLTFVQFVNGTADAKVYRISYETGSCLDVEETINLAEDLVKNPSEWPKFQLLKNNCESFATYLKTKKAVSQQGLRALRNMVGITAGVASLAGSASSTSGSAPSTASSASSTSGWSCSLQ